MESLVEKLAHRPETSGGSDDDDSGGEDMEHGGGGEGEEEQEEEEEVNFIYVRSPQYGVATTSELLKIKCLFCKRAL